MNKRFLLTPTPLSREQVTRMTSMDDLCKELDSFYFEWEEEQTFESEDGQTFGPLLGPLTPSSALAAGSIPAANDEQIVNTALILFLNTVTMHHPAVRADWTLQDRKSTRLTSS